MTTDAPKRKRPRQKAADEPTQEQEVVPASAGALHTEQNLQAVRQTKQGVRQDEQGNRQDEQGVEQAEQRGRIDTLDTKVTDIQDEQGARQDRQSTEQITQGVRQEEQASEQVVQGLKLDAQTHQIEAMAEGVAFLATSVTTLNERVYTKNALDKQRNILIAAAIVFFVLTSAILGMVLVQIRNGDKSEEKRAADRAKEAAEVRHQLADCELPPGLVLADGHKNEGSCFMETQRRTREYIDDAINRIESDIRALLIAQNEAAARNRTLTSEVRQAAAASSAALRQSTPPPTRASSPPTPTTGTTVPQRPPPTTSPPPPPPSGGGGLGEVVCDVLGILGLCG